jgi:hypothetical protein
MRNGTTDPITRRTFAVRASSLFAAMVMTPPAMRHRTHVHSPLDHPEPRPGINADRVLSLEALKPFNERVRDAYAEARTYPVIFDSVACACSCGGRDGNHRSLLVCFETLQATGCQACRDEAMFIGRLAKKDTSLADIRAAVDKKFG